MAQRFILINDHVRNNALAAVRMAPEGFSVSVSEPKRSNDQNAKFHAIVSDIARSPLKWAGKTRTPDQWKAILISGHSVATNYAGEVIPGIEGEFVAIRESSASMTVRRAASLIEYTLAFCAQHGIELVETRRRGFMDERNAA
jgi:hypothetical protein